MNKEMFDNVFVFIFAKSGTVSWRFHRVLF